MVAELFKLRERENRPHVAEGGEVHQIRLVAAEEGLTIERTGEFTQQVVPEFLWRAPVSLDTLSGDDPPHDWESSPSVQAL